MFDLRWRPSAADRRRFVLAGLASLAVMLAVEQAAAGPADPPLGLDEAMGLALTDQPVLEAREAAIRAAEDQAEAAAQLPDPKLTLGLQDVPIDGADAFSLRHDSFTGLTIGVAQDFPRAEKLRLRGARRQIEAEVNRFGLANDRRLVRRETALAWLDVYEAEQGVALARQMAAEAALQESAIGKAYGAVRVGQAEWLAAGVETRLFEDKLHDWQHRAQRFRAALARWIGEAAERPFPKALALPAIAAGDNGRVAAEAAHPLIGGLDKQIEAAQTEVALARQAYDPDISVAGRFAYRRDYADFVGIEVTVDLPLFPERRQDRQASAAREQAAAAQERKRDMLRELHAQARQSALDRQHFQRRVDDFDRAILPAAERRITAAISAYGAGRDSFDAVLLARRALLEARVQRLALAVEAARAQIRLDYFTAQPAGEGP